MLLLRNLKVTNILSACLREDHTLTEEMQQEIDVSTKQLRERSTPAYIE